MLPRGSPGRPPIANRRCKALQAESAPCFLFRPHRPLWSTKPHLIQARQRKDSGRARRAPNTGHPRKDGHTCKNAMEEARGLLHPYPFISRGGCGGSLQKLPVCWGSPKSRSASTSTPRTPRRCRDRRGSSGRRCGLCGCRCGSLEKYP